MKSLTVRGKVGHALTSAGTLGQTFIVWLRLQRGQENLIRWGTYRKRFPRKLRKQTGHEHCCSIYFLCSSRLILMRPYLSLDEALVNDCCVIHDQAEGLLGVDVADPKKTHQNDLDEYEAFKELYGHVDRIVWESKQRSFLLQFCLKNPECFDTEARAVMTELAKTKRNEALFFRGMEMLDYLYYAYENGALGKVPDILKEVSANQVANLDRIAEELPGFSAVVWTPEIRTFFAGAAGLSPKQDAFLV